MLYIKQALRFVLRADPWGTPEVDMHQVSIVVDQDVAIVPVLGLQKEASNRIPAWKHASYYLPAGS